MYHFTSVKHALCDIDRGRIKVARVSDLNDPFELMAPNFRDPGVKRRVMEFRERFDKENGLVCFSCDWTSPLLWSHYGAKHRGMCLGFQVKRSSRCRFVSYVNQRLSDVGADANGDELREQLLCTKYSQWLYEDEARLFVDLGEVEREEPLYFYRFNEELQLREVILGSYCAEPLSTVRELVSMKYPRALTYKAALMHKWFAVGPDFKFQG